MPWEVKFYTRQNEKLFKKYDNTRPADDKIQDIIMSEEIREVFLYTWIKNIQIFMTEYDGQYGQIPVPEKVEGATMKQFRAADLIQQFVSSSLVESEDSIIPLDEFYEKYVQWRDFMDKNLSKSEKRNDVLQKIANSAFGMSARFKDSNIKAVGSDFIGENMDKFCFAGYKFK
jgi:phage/plasmid-associated DNA primase